MYIILRLVERRTLVKHKNQPGTESAMHTRREIHLGRRSHLDERQSLRQFEL